MGLRRPPAGGGQMRKACKVSGPEAALGPGGAGTPNFLGEVGCEKVGCKSWVRSNKPAKDFAKSSNPACASSKMGLRRMLSRSSSSPAAKAWDSGSVNLSPTVVDPEEQPEAELPEKRTSHEVCARQRLLHAAE